MGRIHRVAGRWREDLPASPFRWFLLPAWLVLAPLIAARNRAFTQGLRRIHHLPVPVISIGNLLAGGTGKTPAVRAVGDLLRQRGRCPAVLTRGYRSQGGANEEAQLVGDLPVVTDPDRLRGGRTALGRGADVLILDDGFQHRRLHRDLEVVLIDATRPWGREDGGRGAVLPLGYLRESPAAVRRAHLLWITRWDQADPARRAQVLHDLARLAPGVPVVHDRLVGMFLRPLTGGPAEDPVTWAGRPVVLASGIGHPAAFEDLCHRAGLAVTACWRFPDHHHFTQAEADRLASAGGTLVVTGKDAVKLAALPRPPAAWVLEARHDLADEGPLVLAGLLDRLLGSAPPSPG